MAGLFGGSRQPGIGWGDRFAAFAAGMGSPGGAQQYMAGRRSQLAQEQEMMRLEEERKRQEMIQDRLRAQLSPADTPMGSGTGAMPDQAQMDSALYEARILGADVAPFQEAVAMRERNQNASQLFANDPRAQMLARQGNQAFFDSIGEQYKPQVIAEGGMQSVYGEGRQVRNPRTREFGNSLVRDTPEGVETVATRGPSYSEQASLQNANTAQMNSGFTLGDGQVRFAPNGQPLADNPRDPSSRPITEGQAKDGFNAERLVRSGSTIAQMEGDGFDFGRSMVTGGQLRGDFRSYQAAALEWTDAMLRLTSGAQAPKAEVEAQMRAYFPQPGDDPNVRAQKAEMRAAAEQAAVTRAGAGYQGGQSQGQGQGGQGSGSGPIAVNRQTGERVQWNGSQWVRIP